MPLARRPLLRAAMVGGTAYAAGKRTERGREREASQEERLEQLEGEQAVPAGAPAAVTPPAAGGMTDDTIAQLAKLGQLHDQGVLTDVEFADAKRKLLGG